MKTRVLMLAAAALVGTQAMAADLADTDGNGTYSMDEMVAAYPDLTEDEFAEADADASGEIDPGELATAIEEGVIPK